MIAFNETGGKPAVSLSDIDSLTQKYADAHAILRDKVQTLDDAIEKLKREHLPSIRKAVATAADRKLKLAAAIEGNPELFKSPRTLIIHGVKVGLQKGKGGIQFADADKVVAAIRRHYEADAAAKLIHVEERPDKEALTKLAANELKKLGCEVVNTSDRVVISVVDSDVDKIVEALLKDATDEVAA